MSDVDDLVMKAQQQLEEHKKWLADELEKLPIEWRRKYNLVEWALEIKLRVARTDGKLVSAVYEYPDVLYLFLSSDAAPKHLRDTLAGGHVVDPNQPSWSARRTNDEG
jgi:hypothetical protein